MVSLWSTKSVARFSPQRPKSWGEQGRILTFTGISRNRRPKSHSIFILVVDPVYLRYPPSGLWLLDILGLLGVVQNHCAIMQQKCKVPYGRYLHNEALYAFQYTPQWMRHCSSVYGKNLSALSHFIAVSGSITGIDKLDSLSSLGSPNLHSLFRKL